MALLAGLAGAAATGAEAQTNAAASSANLAKKLSNPVADLISVPLQFNHNSGFFEAA